MNTEKTPDFTIAVLSETVNRTLHQKPDDPVKYWTPDNSSQRPRNICNNRPRLMISVLNYDLILINDLNSVIYYV